jgi:hypothetical protein
VTAGFWEFDDVDGIKRHVAPQTFRSCCVGDSANDVASDQDEDGRMRAIYHIDEHSSPIATVCLVPPLYIIHNSFQRLRRLPKAPVAVLGMEPPDLVDDSKDPGVSTPSTHSVPSLLSEHLTAFCRTDPT